MDGLVFSVISFYDATISVQSRLKWPTPRSPRRREVHGKAVNGETCE